MLSKLSGNASAGYSYLKVLNNQQEPCHWFYLESQNLERGHCNTQKYIKFSPAKVTLFDQSY